MKEEGRLAIVVPYAIYEQTGARAEPESFLGWIAGIASAKAAHICQSNFLNPQSTFASVPVLRGSGTLDDHGLQQWNGMEYELEEQRLWGVEGETQRGHQHTGINVPKLQGLAVAEPEAFTGMELKLERGHPAQDPGGRDGGERQELGGDQGRRGGGRGQWQ